MLRCLIVFLLSFNNFAANADTIHRGNGAEPTTIDPQKCVDLYGMNITRDLFKGLTALDAKGNIIPGAALEWSCNESGTVYVFKLRPNAVWSDGSSVTADDFVYAFQRLVNPAEACYYGYLGKALRNGAEILNGKNKDFSTLGAKALDAYTLELSFVHPMPQLLSFLSHPAFMPVKRSCVEKYKEQWTRAGNLVSNGAYSMQEWVPNEYIKLVHNPRYWDTAHIKVKNVNYYPVTDSEAALQMFRRGSLHMVFQVPGEKIAWIKEHMPDTHHSCATLGVYYYIINLDRAPFKEHPELIQALSLAIDRESMVKKVTLGSEEPAYSFVPPTIKDYTPAYLDFKTMSQQDRNALARKIYAEAGYGPNNPLEIELLFGNSPLRKRVVTAVANMWKQVLGIKTTQRVEEWKVMLSQQKKRNFQVTAITWTSVLNDPTDFLEQIYSKGDVAITGYSNPGFDDLYDKAMQTNDAHERALLLKEAEALMLKTQPIIPVYYNAFNRVVSKELQGYYNNPMDIHPTEYMSLKHSS